MIADTYRSPSGMIKGKVDYFFFYFRRRFIGKGLRDWWPINQAIKTTFLEGPLVLIELAAGNTVAAAGFLIRSSVFQQPVAM